MKIAVPGVKNLFLNGRNRRLPEVFRDFWT
jgi:hypothetical protein